VKLFLRDHLPLVVLEAVQLFAVLLVYWLDGYRDLRTALYSVFLGIVFVGGYLAYRYVANRSLYRTLSETPASMDEALKGGDSAPLPAALDRLLETQYALYQTKLQAAKKARDDHLVFINQWVHQMKTPLSVMRLTLEDRDDARSVSVLEEADRMEQGLETVLHAARLETFDRDFQVGRVSLKAVAEGVVRDNKRLFIGSNVFPEMKVDPDLTVESDAKWLGFLVGQLVTNAVKYSSGSEAAGKVVFASAVRDGEATLEIRDGGIGIPPEDRKRVFQPFYTGDNGRKFRESTGMGLYFAKEIADRLGHRLELDSEVGVGTTVRVVFSSYLTKM